MRSPGRGFSSADASSAELETETTLSELAGRDDAGRNAAASDTSSAAAGIVGLFEESATAGV